MTRPGSHPTTHLKRETGSVMTASRHTDFAPVRPTAEPIEAQQESWLFSTSQIDLNMIRAILVRNRWTVLSICVAGMLLGIAITLLTVPVYRAESSIQIDQQVSQVLDTPDVQPVEAVQDVDRFLQTQVGVLESRTLAIRVAETLDLFSGNGFLNAMRVDPDTSTVEKLGAVEAHREQVIALLRKNLQIALPQESRIAKIAFDSPDPALSARVANAFAEIMIAANLSRRYDTSAYARRFLQEQLAEAKERLEASERAMVGYARQTGIIDTKLAAQPGQLGQADGGSLTTSSLLQSNDVLSAVKARRIDAQQLWESARTARLTSLPEVLSNPAVQTMMERRATLEANYADQSQRRQHDHPDLIRGRSEIAAVNARIGDLAQDIKTSIYNRYRAALLQEHEMQGAVDRLKGATINEQDRSIRYNILRREVNTNRELYDGLLQRFKQLSAAAGMSANNISIIDLSPIPVRPVSPNLLVNLGLAILASFVIALGFVYIRENFDDIVRSTEEAERKLGLPALGMVPTLEGGAVAFEELERPFSPYSEAFHAIRSTIELSHAGGVPRSIMISSSQKGEGKTSSAYAIARDFARLGGRRILLVDADLRRPSLHKVLGLTNEAGLVNLLARQQKLGQVTRPTTTPGLDFISSGPIAPNPAELLGSPMLPALIEEFAQSYDIVIIDGPPVLGLADAPSIAAHVEATLFIVDASNARRGMIKAALRRLRNSRANVLGVVLNRINVATLGYGYEQYYDYSHESQAAKGAVAAVRGWFRR